MLQKLFGFGRSALSAQIKTVTPQELQRRLQNGESVILIDVRTPHEYRQEGHIQGSRLIPLAELPQRSDKLPKDRSIICVCHSGSRSQVACKQLVSQGFADVTNLVGGMIAWRRAGFSTKRS